ncbi:MAG TPA: DddA-like double-stranded DNA deaminase toxin [Vicinamibacterales bacterium]
MGDSIWDVLKNIRFPQASGHPSSPAKSSGAGGFRSAEPLGNVAKRMAQSSVRTAAEPNRPHPGSPAGRYVPWEIDLSKPETDGSFQFSFSRSGGLTKKESALLQRAHSYFGLKMGADGKIAAVLILPNGTVHALVSGKHGGPHGGSQDGFLPRGAGSGVNRFNVTHVEGHTAAILHRKTVEVMNGAKVGEAALLLPKGPCGACDPNVPSMLPSGTRLFVVDPDTTNVYQSTSGLTTQGMKFTRPDKLKFTIPKNMVRIKAIGKYAGRTAGAAALGILAGWLRGKMEEGMIERQIKQLGPDIERALHDHVDKVLELIGGEQQAFANVTVEIMSITTLEAEPAPMHFTTFPVVTLKSVTVSAKNIDKPEPTRRDFDGLMTTNTTLYTFSFEIDL